MSDYDFYITPEEYKIAEKNGINCKTVNNRVRSLGWTKTKAITLPVKKRALLDEDLLRIAKENGIGRETLRYRLNNGWSKEDASTKKQVDIRSHMKELGLNTRKYSKELLAIALKNGIGVRTFYRRVQKDKMDPYLAAITPLVTPYEKGLLGKEAFLKANMY